MKKTITSISALALIAALSIVTFAAIIVDQDGVGFVGKGDVQLAFGWSNAQLQANADSVSFELETKSVTITEASWVCTNSRNENTQERERTTTTTISRGGLVNSIARVKNQITGFNLNGFANGTQASTSTTASEGPELDSCPTNWVKTGDTVTETLPETGGSRTLTIKAPGKDDVVIDMD